jgi:hypothetical protein
MWQHDAQPEQDQDHELIVDVVRNHRIAPLHDGVGGPFYPVFRPQELSAAVGYTTFRSISQKYNSLAPHFPALVRHPRWSTASQEYAVALPADLGIALIRAHPRVGLETEAQLTA